MKRIIKIGGSVTGVVPTAPYANYRPHFIFEETWEIDDTPIYSDDDIIKRNQELYEMTKRLFDDASAQAMVEAIQRERADLRFRPHPTTGAPVPSVTSIRDWDADFYVTAEELKQYASQSNIVHAKVHYYIEKGGVWVKGDAQELQKKLPDIYFDIVVVTKGSLGLSVDTGDFPAFLKAYPINAMKNGTRVFNDEHWYCGLPDFTGLPNFKGWLNEPTLFDVKRTPDKVKDGMQLSAYAHALKIEQAGIIPLNNKTAQGYSKPILYTKADLEMYFKLFLQKRKDFRKRYGV